jgi:hypothetical protein
VLTKPSKPAHNEGYDNEDYDYILYVNDWLGNEDGHKCVEAPYWKRQLNFLQSVSHSGYPWPRNLWSGGEVSEHENPRDRCSESGEKQACVLQPEYDGGHDLGAGAFLHD